MWSGRRRLVRVLAVTAMLALASAACGSDTGASDSAGTASSSATAPPVDGAESSTPAPPDDRAESSEPAPPGDGLFPDVLEASARRAADGTWDVSATLSSPYDTPERYADAWRVVGPDGSVLGVRELTHDHAAEQPFTRSLSGVTIDDDIDVVVIEGRDQRNGWGGQTVSITLER